MTRKRASTSLALATLFAGTSALSGTFAAPIAHASPLDGIRAAVNAVRSESPCGALNYNVDLEGNAQALVGNNLPGVPPSGRYKGTIAENTATGDPTAQATQSLIWAAYSRIKDCSFKDFGVGMLRDDDAETSTVALTLGEPAEPPPVPAPQPKPTKQCPDGSTVAADQPCPPEQPPVNAVTMDIQRAGSRVAVTVTNTSNLAGKCTYNAEEVNKLGLPVSRDFDIGPKGSTTLDFPAPLLGQTYHVEVACRGDFKGENVEFGRVAQDVSG
jgi:hypothetical protein